MLHLTGRYQPVNVDQQMSCGQIENRPLQLARWRLKLRGFAWAIFINAVRS